MPDLGKSFFQGEKDLNLKEIASLETTNISDGVTTVLLKHGWDANKLGSGVVLELSPDNLHVARANFFLRGPLGDDGITVQAAKCWPTADDDIVLHFKFPAGEKFSFSSGGVFSDYLDSNEFTHSFHSVDEEGNQTDVEESEWSDGGIGPFSLRVVAYPTKASKPKNGIVIKINVLLFPMSSSDLIDLCDASQSPSWPGIRVLETE